VKIIDNRIRILWFIPLLLISSISFAAEQSGPNPGNLTPAGSNSVSLYTGAFTYTYPIEIPAGRNGTQPALNLVYNSQAGNGWLGIGWDLSVGSIQRSTKNGVPKYDDTSTGTSDIFIFNLNGQSSELVRTNPGETAYWEYLSQIESSFTIFRYYPDQRNWFALDKTGKKYDFKGLIPNGGTYCYWGLVKVADTNGNDIEFTYNIAGVIYMASGGGGSGPSGTTSYLPSTINYNGNSNQPLLAPNYSIQFYFDDRPDKISGYNSGVLQQLTNRLKEIQILSNGQPLRKYTFNFDYTEASISRLISIQKSGYDARTSQWVAFPNATLFSYQQNMRTVTSSGGYSSMPDFNYLLEFYKDPYGSSITSFPTASEILDVNGDGLPDILGNDGDSQKQAWLNSGNGWVSDNSWISPLELGHRITNELNRQQYDDKGIVFADINGDGIVDIVKKRYLSNRSERDLSYDTGWRDPEFIEENTYLGTANGWIADNSWKLPAGLWITKKSKYLHWDFMGQRKDSECFVNYTSGGCYLIDINGDGKADIVCRGAAGNGVWINNGHGWDPSTNWSVPTELGGYCVNFLYGKGGYNDYGVRFVDLNGDGLVDIIQKSSGNGRDISRVWLNTGLGWVEDLSGAWNMPEAIVAWNSVAYFWLDQGIRFIDINNDGLTDIVQSDVLQNKSAVWLNTGNGWVPNDAWIPSSGMYFTNTGFRMVDLNLDGIPDEFMAQTGSYAQKSVKLYSAGPANVITNIKDDYGTNIFVDYQLINNGIPFPVVAVKKVSINNGLGSQVETRYGFSQPKYQAVPIEKREFLGFGAVTTTDARDSYTTTKFLQDQNAVDGINIFKGKISEQASYDSSGVLLTRTSNTYDYTMPAAGVYFPRLTRTDSFIGNKQSAVTYSYDNYGNLNSTSYQGDVSLSGDEKTEILTYGYNTSDYLVCYPINKKLLDASGNTISESNFYYEPTFTQTPTKGNLTKTERWNNNGSNSVITSSYDDYGNVRTQCDARWNKSNGTEGNQVTKTYDPVYNLFVSTITNSLGQTESFTYNNVGQVLTHKDINGQTTRYDYDAFNRPVKEIGPNDTSAPSTSYEYTINAAPPHKVVTRQRINFVQSPTLDTYVFLDGLGRKCETKSPMPNGKQGLSGIVKYNSLGLVENTYLPCSVAASVDYSQPDYNKPFSKTEYDSLGRVIKVTNPDGTFSSTIYSDWSETHINEKGVAKDYVKDAYGQIKEVHEHNNDKEYITNYVYDALGNLSLIINSNSQVTVINYDSLSRKLSMIDPVMGFWQYAYDVNGNLISQTDASSNTITMQYDRLNRINLKLYPNNDKISFYYDNTDNGNCGIGRLTKVTDLSGTTDFTYDSLGRNTSKNRTIGTVLTPKFTSSEFDALGREIKLTYPDLDYVNNVYDTSLLKTVKNSSNTLTYATLAYDEVAFGKLSSISYGNGMVTNYTYKPNNLRLNTLITQKSSLLTQNFSYNYDNVGNISDIKDNITNNTQSYLYDTLDRLLVSMSTSAASVKCYEYDRVGNIIYNPDNFNTPSTFSFDGDLKDGTINGATWSNGRLGQGLSFDGSSTVTLNNYSSSTKGLTIECWVRQLNGGEIIRKDGCFAISCDTNTKVNAWVIINGIQQSISTTGLDKDVWKDLVLTYDGTIMKLYLNGQLKASLSVTGNISTNANPIILGTGFSGKLDELNIYGGALTAAQVLCRYQVVPNYVPTQPKTPESVPSNLYTGVKSTSYKFRFTSWDPDGDRIKYTIDWGDGKTQQTALLTNGTVFEATHTWTVNWDTLFNIKVQAIDEHNATSQWSPVWPITIAPARSTKYSGQQMIGNSSGYLIGKSSRIAGTLGETLTGRTQTSKYKIFSGFQGDGSNNSSWWATGVGQDNPGNSEAAPPSKAPASSVSNLTNTNDIINAINQYPSQVLKDANGNKVIANGRWIKYDYENRPVKIVTQDGTTTSYSYDYEGQRVIKRQLNAQGAELSKTVYIGTIYEESGSEVIKYIHAGGQRVAMKSSLNGVQYFHQDHLGSTNQISNTSGAVVRTQTYFPYGNMQGTSGSKDNPHKFTGQILDSDSGLYYYNARYYDPTLCTFVTPDNTVPVKTNLSNFKGLEINEKYLYDPQMLNKYSYCRNNPIKYVDPKGEEPVTCALILGVSALVNFGIDYYSAYRESGKSFSDFYWSYDYTFLRGAGMMSLGALTSAGGGMIGASGYGLLSKSMLGGALSTLSYSSDRMITNKNITVKDLSIASIGGVLTMGISHVYDKEVKSILNAMGKDPIVTEYKWIQPTLNMPRDEIKQEWISPLYAGFTTLYDTASSIAQYIFQTKQPNSSNLDFNTRREFNTKLDLY
jgi:RHS repeat-associated protein